LAAAGPRDHRGRLWVCANEADELVALNGKGRIVERHGSFRGIAHDGAAKDGFGRS
jgi:hypothetical protein